jgi:aldose 1-epimerase
VTELPSGRQFEIARGSQRAVAVEVGGGLRLYDADGQPVLDGYSDDEMVGGGRGAVLAPWPNRLSGGAYEFQGARYQLAHTEPDRHHAIHGLVRWANWACAEHTADRVRLAIILHPQPGYPFCLSLSVEYALSDAGLTVTSSAENAGSQAAPFGLGHHPYLTAGTDRVDAARLQLPAASHLELNDRAIPTCVVLPLEGTELDFRRPKPIDTLQLDTPYADLIFDADGRARVVLEGRRRVTLWMDRAFGYIQVFTGDTLQPPARRRQGLAVEPMTCAPDAFNNHLGLRILQPGQTFTASWGLLASPS